MAKDKHKFTVEIDVDDLGVASKHEFLMANDQDYRDAALTPPGGKAPGEAGREPSPCPDTSGINAASLVAAGAK
jgi:hypothetical protein